MTSPVIRLRIVVLLSEPDEWCDNCGACCATTTVYAVEEPTSAPFGVHRLTFCETCEGHLLY